MFSRAYSHRPSWGGKREWEREAKEGKFPAEGRSREMRIILENISLSREVYSCILRVGLKKRGLEDLKEISVVMW